MAAVSGQANYYRITDSIPSEGIFSGDSDYYIIVRIDGNWLVPDETLNPGEYLFDGHKHVAIAFSAEDVQAEVNRMLVNRPQHVLLSLAAYNALSPKASNTAYLISG